MRCQVDFIPKDIQRITPTGLETTDGQHYDLDIVICATGGFDAARFTTHMRADVVKATIRVTSSHFLSSVGPVSRCNNDTIHTL